MLPEHFNALQDAWPDATCYGCGPANPHGLHIKSYWSESDDAAICVFTGQPYHNAGFDDVMYGGMVASLCDCHSVWTAIAATYRRDGREHGSLPAISYVTANLNVSFLAPTPLTIPIKLVAHVEKIAGRKAVVRCSVYGGEVKTAEATVTAVRVPLDKSAGATMPR